MKKLFLTTVILLGMTLGAFADGFSGETGWLFFDLFGHNEDPEEATVGLFENGDLDELEYDEMMSESPFVNIKSGLGGLFGRGDDMSTDMGDGFRNGNGFLLPSSHGQTDDSSAPLGSGVVVLMGLGAAYLVAKKRKEE
jgi:hypothetical protein